MEFLDRRHAKVFSHEGFDICTLIKACPRKGDSLGYVIDNARFAGRDFNQICDAVNEIDRFLYGKMKAESTNEVLNTDLSMCSEKTEYAIQMTNWFCNGTGCIQNVRM